MLHPAERNPARVPRKQPSTLPGSDCDSPAASERQGKVPVADDVVRQWEKVLHERPVLFRVQNHRYSSTNPVPGTADKQSHEGITMLGCRTVAAFTCMDKLGWVQNIVG